MPMAAKKKTTDLSNYYVIQFEKYIDLVTEVERKYYILSELIKTEVDKTKTEEWENTQIPALLECFVNINDTRSFLSNKINNASDEEIKIAKENNIKDVLIKKDELQRMNVLLLAGEQLEVDLQNEYKISLSTHWQVVKRG